MVSNILNEPAASNFGVVEESREFHQHLGEFIPDYTHTRIP
jgi:glutamate-1-semialdehyde aminotransferase